MKLTNFSELWSQVRLYNIGMIAKTELLLFSQDGLDTNLEDVFSSDNGELLTLIKDGTVRKTTAYISERPSYYDEKGWEYPKYHIYDCQTMQTMRANDRGHRYKKTMRDDGNFFMLITSKDRKSNKIEIELNVCGYCFNKYKEENKDGVSKKEFKIKDYFAMPINKATPFIEIEDDYTTVPRFYSNNWEQISTLYKKQLDYTCQECGIVLTGQYSKYLHTHHIDGNPTRNTVSNLKVVCIECHAKEFNHGHIKNKPDYIKFLSFKKGI